MILQSLVGYYEKKEAEGHPDFLRAGLERRPIRFVIVLDKEGTPIAIEDTSDSTNKKGRVFVVPQAVPRSGKTIKPNFLWDTPEYALGIEKPDGKGAAVEKNAAFVARIVDEFGSEPSTPSIAATLAFFRNQGPQQLPELQNYEALVKGPGEVSFRYVDELKLVTEAEAALKAATNTKPDSIGNGACLVTGEIGPLTRLHPQLTGFPGAQSAGASLVSFNFGAAESWGRSQGALAPTGTHAAFAYGTALRYLSSRKNGHCLSLADMQLLFWSESPSPVEEAIAFVFGEAAREDDSMTAQKVKALYQSPIAGRRPLDDDTTRFYVLGLAPNAARLSVRLWQVLTVKELSERIVQHFDDLRIVRREIDPEYPSLSRLMGATVREGKRENIPPNLGGDVTRAILAGTNYPHTLLSAAIRRVRTERRVSYLHAAIIKACLIRMSRQKNIIDKEVGVSLDENNSSDGYQLGRLFAILERIQEQASPGLNATIRERYYGAASTTPRTVLPQLMRLKNHHIAKLDHMGRVTFFEKLLGQVMSRITEFPAQLSLEEQGRFAIGYYHQRQSFFTKNESQEGATV